MRVGQSREIYRKYWNNWNYPILKITHLLFSYEAYREFDELIDFPKNSY